MKALFVTTPTMDCANHVRAWDSFAESVHSVFNPRGIRNCWRHIDLAREYEPDAIFYIGPFEGRGVPRPQTFRMLRELAPTINVVSDAADRPWHGVLDAFAAQGCFDLQVAIDGAVSAPVDHVTVTPVDPRPFGGSVKHVRCGFSGSVGGRRTSIVRGLERAGYLKVRTGGGSYAAHARFLSACEMVLNVSYTGTGAAHHIKGRVLEAGWARACLLEHRDSPIGDWFPDDCYASYDDASHAADLIANMDRAEIRHTAARLHEEVSSRFAPEKIYGEMLSLVDCPLAVAAA